MRVRLAYLERGNDGSLVCDGRELAARIDLEGPLPRIGEAIILPLDLCKRTGTTHQRFEVVAIDHCWHKPHAVAISIYVATLYTLLRVPEAYRLEEVTQGIRALHQQSEDDA